MAIVFISPKRKQKIFLWVIIAASIVVVALVLALVFLPDFFNKDAPVNVPMLMPTLSINSDILDSNNVKNLEVIGSLPLSFLYVVQDKDGKRSGGTISASSRDDAQAILEGKGYTVVSLQEAGLGRTNPYLLY